MGGVVRGEVAMVGGGRERSRGGWKKNHTNSYAIFFLSLSVCQPMVDTPQKSYSHSEVKSMYIYEMYI